MDCRRCIVGADLSVRPVGLRSRCPCKGKSVRAAREPPLRNMTCHILAIKGGHSDPPLTFPIPKLELTSSDEIPIQRRHSGACRNDDNLKTAGEDSEAGLVLPKFNSFHFPSTQTADSTTAERTPRGCGHDSRASIPRYRRPSLGRSRAGPGRVQGRDFAVQRHVEKAGHAESADQVDGSSGKC